MDGSASLGYQHVAATLPTYFDSIRDKYTPGNPSGPISAAASPASYRPFGKNSGVQRGLPRSSLPFPWLQVGKPQGRKCHILSCMPLIVTHWCLERSGCLVSVSSALGRVHLWGSSCSDESGRPSAFVFSHLCQPVPSGAPGVYLRCNDEEERGKGGE